MSENNEKHQDLKILLLSPRETNGEKESGEFIQIAGEFAIIL